MSDSTFRRKLVSLYRHGYRNFHNLDYKQAIKCYLTALECYLPEKTVSLYQSKICFNIAICYLACCDFSEAEKYLILSIENDPFLAVSMYYLGLVNKILYRNDRGHFKFCLDCMNRYPNHPYLDTTNLNGLHMLDEALNIKYIDYRPIGLNFILEKSMILELIEIEKSSGLHEKLSKKFSPTEYFKKLDVFEPGIFIRNATDGRDYLTPIKKPEVLYVKRRLKKIKKNKVKTRVGFRYVIFKNFFGLIKGCCN